MVVHEFMMKFKEKSSLKPCLPQNPVKKGYSLTSQDMPRSLKCIPEIRMAWYENNLGERVAKTFGQNICGKDHQL